jgi:hypothetical protein
MAEYKMENMSGPIGELISIIAKKCNVKESMGYFLSKNKIAFLSIVAIIGKIVYGEEKIKLEKDENYEKIIEQLAIALLINKKNGKDVIETIIAESKNIKYSIEEYARQIFEIFEVDEEILRRIMEFLIVITIIEIGFPEEEDNYLRKVAKIFRINELEYFNMKNSCIKRGNCLLETEITDVLRKEISGICSCNDFFIND